MLSVAKTGNNEKKTCTNRSTPVSMMVGVQSVPTIHLRTTSAFHADPCCLSSLSVHIKGLQVLSSLRAILGKQLHSPQRNPISSFPQGTSVAGTKEVSPNSKFHESEDRRRETGASTHRSNK